VLPVRCSACWALGPALGLDARSQRGELPKPSGQCPGAGARRREQESSGAWQRQGPLGVSLALASKVGLLRARSLLAARAAQALRPGPGAGTLHSGLSCAWAEQPATQQSRSPPHTSPSPSHTLAAGEGSPGTGYPGGTATPELVAHIQGRGDVRYNFPRVDERWHALPPQSCGLT